MFAYASILARNEMWLFEWLVLDIQVLSSGISHFLNLSSSLFCLHLFWPQYIVCTARGPREQRTTLSSSWGPRCSSCCVSGKALCFSGLGPTHFPAGKARPQNLQSRYSQEEGSFRKVRAEGQAEREYCATLLNNLFLMLCYVCTISDCLANKKNKIICNQLSFFSFVKKDYTNALDL